MATATKPQIELPFQSLEGCWRDVQSEMQKVTRWDSVRKDWPNLRLQNDLQHTYGMEGLTIRLLCQLREKFPELKLDETLVLTSVHVHDQGEMRLQSDIPYSLKTDERDLEEYLAYEKHLICETPATAKFLRRAFLLQFALKNPKCFPDDARELMKDLAANNKNEAHVFDCIERIDYMLFANESWDKDIPYVLVRVLRNQFEKFEELAGKFPPFKELLWEQEKPRCLAILKAYEEQFL